MRGWGGDETGEEVERFQLLTVTARLSSCAGRYSPKLTAPPVLAVRKQVGGQPLRPAAQGLRERLTNRRPERETWVLNALLLPPGECRAGIGPDMREQQRFSADQAREVGEQIGIDWSSAPFDVEQFRMGMEVELEHGLHDLGRT